MDEDEDDLVGDANYGLVRLKMPRWRGHYDFLAKQVPERQLISVIVQQPVGRGTFHELMAFATTREAFPHCFAVFTKHLVDADLIKFPVDTDVLLVFPKTGRSGEILLCDKDSFDRVVKASMSAELFEIRLNLTPSSVYFQSESEDEEVAPRPVSKAMESRRSDSQRSDRGYSRRPDRPSPTPVRNDWWTL